MIKQFFGLALEIIELIVQRIYLIFLVFLLNHGVELGHNFMSLLSHLLDLVLDHTDDFIFIALNPASNVIVHEINDIVDFRKMLGNDFLRFVH